jgi:hypothetical protein
VTVPLLCVDRGLCERCRLKVLGGVFLRTDASLFVICFLSFRTFFVSFFFFFSVYCGGYKCPDPKYFQAEGFFGGRQLFFLWIGAYAGLQSDVPGVRGCAESVLSLLIVPESSEAEHA